MVRSLVIVAFMAFVSMSVMCSENTNLELFLVTNNATSNFGQDSGHLQDYVVTHTFGRRESGDGLVAYGAEDYVFDSPQNVQLTLFYPVSGTGVIVTYVNVKVKQSSNIHSSYITSGGIGQRRISFVVTANNTNYFNYVATLYGRP